MLESERVVVAGAFFAEVIYFRITVHYFLLVWFQPCSKAACCWREQGIQPAQNATVSFRISLRHFNLGVKKSELRNCVFNASLYITVCRRETCWTVINLDLFKIKGSYISPFVAVVAVF